MRGRVVCISVNKDWVWQHHIFLILQLLFGCVTIIEVLLREGILE